MGPKIDLGKKKETSANSARNKFMQMDSRNQKESDVDVELPSTHQNTITSIRPYKSAGASTMQFSTTGVDGMLVIWDLLNKELAGLRLQ